MPRYIDCSRHQSLLLPVQLLHQLHPGTFEHAVDHFVDHVLDLSALDARYANDAGGAPAYNPRALLKVILFAYSRGIDAYVADKQLRKRDPAFLTAHRH